MCSTESGVQNTAIDYHTHGRGTFPATGTTLTEPNLVYLNRQLRLASGLDLVRPCVVPRSTTTISMDPGEGRSPPPPYVAYRNMVAKSTNQRQDRVAPPWAIGHRTRATAIRVATTSCRPHVAASNAITSDCQPCAYKQPSHPDQSTSTTRRLHAPDLCRAQP